MVAKRLIGVHMESSSKMMISTNWSIFLLLSVTGIKISILSDFVYFGVNSVVVVVVVVVVVMV